MPSREMHVINNTKLSGLSQPVRVIAVTGRLETDFVGPVPVGTTLYLEAEVTAVAGRKIYSTATGRGARRSASASANPRKADAAPAARAWWPACCRSR